MTTLDEIGAAGRAIWHDQMSLTEIVIAMGVVYGDLARVARDQPDTQDIDLHRELGNMIASTIRWCGHLGINPAEAVAAALAAQREWTARSTRPRGSSSERTSTLMREPSAP